MTNVTTDDAAQPVIYKGLAGVPVDYTAISKVNSETNSLLYRGYAVQDLAANCSFEEVAYLLWQGELPDERQLAEFETRERSLRHLRPRGAPGDRRTSDDRASDGRLAHRGQRDRRP